MAENIRRTAGIGLCGWLLVLSWAFLGFGLVQPAAAQVEGMPKVIDGDTIEIEGQAIRLFGIDAPEMGQTCRIKENLYDCGMVARTALLDLTAGTPVICKVIPLVKDISPEGAPGRCTAAGYDLSEGMAYTGWALAERTASERYIVYEERARDAGRGLWKGDFVAPWDWRGGKRLPEAGQAN